MYKNKKLSQKLLCLVYTIQTNAVQEKEQCKQQHDY